MEPDMINGHVYVEMGDDLKWATCNVGADKPEEVGALFAWGETTPKATYSLDNYKWYKDGNYTKYNSTDSKQILSKEDDAATANREGLGVLRPIMTSLNFRIIVSVHGMMQETAMS